MSAASPSARPTSAASPKPASEDPDFTFDGLNPRTKTKPGDVPGEIVYPKILHPVTKQPVSSKPANDDIVPPEPWTLWRMLKTLVMAVMLAAVLGKFITTSPVWGYEKQISKIWREHIWKPAPIHLNHVQLARYNGRDPTKPIYLAIDSEIFDVSANRRVYGPGGSYNMMTGTDASRAFVTGCFQPHHLTHDLRGLTPTELEGVTKWKSFFAKNEKYSRVGTVSLPPIDPSSPIPADCHVEGGATPLAPGQKAAAAGGATGSSAGSIAVPVPVAEKVQEDRKEGKSEL